MTKKLLNLVAAMQSMASHYIEPGPYTEQTTPLGDGMPETASDNDADRYDGLFARDMLYMLDNPKQREAQAEAQAVADFIPNAMRTCSPGFYGEKVGLTELISALQAGIAAAGRLDRMKKALFYGRDYIANDARPQAAYPQGRDQAFAIIANVIPDNMTADNDVMEQLFHAIIGTFTEAGEMLEAWLKAYMHNGQIDVVNMREEFGDNLWYLAVGMNAVEQIDGQPCDFETEMRRVIAKLKTRFPLKFETEQANNRDLAAERAVLEGRDPTAE